MKGTVVPIGRKSGESLTGDDGKTRVKTDASFARSTPGVFDAVILFGERVSSDFMKNASVLGFIRRANETGKLVIAIDQAPLLLVSAGIVRGRIMTGWPTIWEKLREAGAFAPAAPLSVDGNVTTVMGPEHIDDVCMLLPKLIERTGRAA